MAVDGELSGVDLSSQTPDFTATETLVEGGVEDFSFTGGLTPGEEFVAIIDNSASGVDTTMGAFDEFGAAVSVNDDGSPVGDGLGSAVTGSVDANGEINLSVSGFEDFDFDGIDDGTGFDHTESGEFSLEVYLGIGGFGDVDFYTFTGLTAGEAFSAEIVSGDPDTILGLFDASGNLIESDDDGGNDLLSRIVGVVGASGSLTFAVTGFDDFDFDGLHPGTG